MTRLDAISRRPLTKLRTSVRQPIDLSQSERLQMYNLMSDHFENVDRGDFERDLAEKEWIITISDAGGGIMGFTTAMQLETELNGTRLTALFSGDTMLHPEIWGTSAWMRVLARHAAALMRESDDRPVYWLLLTATHRTYRALPTFLKDYYPRPDIETPLIFRERMESLVRLKFPDEYDSTHGVVRLKKPTPVNADRVHLVTEGLTNPRAHFFAKHNPGFLNGDYLVCIGELSHANRTRLGHRLFAD